METEAAQTTAEDTAAQPAADEATGIDALAEALRDYKPDEQQDEPAAETEAEKDGEEPPEPAKKDKPEKQDEPKARADDLFTEKALSTPEGLKRAREHVERHHRKLDGYSIKLEKRNRDLDAREAEVKEGQAKLGSDRELARRLSPVWTAIKDGDAADVMTAVAAAFGRDARKFHEEYTRAMIRSKKADPKVSELEEKIRLLEEENARRDKELSERDEQQQVAYERAMVARRSAEVAEVASNAEAYPLLSQYDPQEIVATVVQVKKEAKARGQKLSDEKACALIESQLATLVAPAARTSAEAGTGPSRPQGDPRKAKPTASSISPSVARSGGAVRELTDTERVEALKRDPVFLSQLFGE